MQYVSFKNDGFTPMTPLEMMSAQLLFTFTSHIAYTKLTTSLEFSR